MTDIKLHEKFKVEYGWFDCTCQVKCPYCGDFIILDSENEPYTCDCGHVFELISYVVEKVADEVRDGEIRLDMCKIVPATEAGTMVFMLTDKQVEEIKTNLLLSYR